MRLARFSCFFALSTAATAAGAVNFSVNTTADLDDVAPGNGECSGFISDTCSLRAAVQEANALPGNDIIFLDAGQTYLLTQAGQDDDADAGDLDITDNVTIIFLASGERPIVDAGGLERAFEVHSGNATLVGFDITGGDATIGGDAAGGGIAIDFDAGIVQLSLLRFYGNQACYGGGLYNDGAQTTVSASEFFDNVHEGDGCAPPTGGSAIRNRGTMTLEYSSLYENDGTAIYSVTTDPSIIGPGVMTIRNTTISSNLGGGLFTDNENDLIDQVTTLRNVTIAGNTGVGLHLGGIDTHLTQRSTMIAHNNVGGAVGDCQLSQATSASYTTDSYNLDSDGTCELEGGTSNYPDTDPLLTPLKYRGGLTQVHWPRPDSPVIDAGHPVIGAIGCEEEDQHLVERPQDYAPAPDNNCDVGAVEISEDVIFFDSHETL